MTERVGVIARIRALAVGIAKAWVDQQKAETALEKSDEPAPAAEKRPRRRTKRRYRRWVSGSKRPAWVCSRQVVISVTFEDDDLLKHWMV